MSKSKKSKQSLGILKNKKIAVSVIGAATVALLSTGVVFADRAKPGDALHQVDKSLEKLNSLMAFSSAEKAEVKVRIAQERLEEVSEIPSEDTERLSIAVDELEAALAEARTEVGKIKIKIKTKEDLTGKIDQVQQILASLLATLGTSSDNLKEIEIKVKDNDIKVKVKELRNKVDDDIEEEKEDAEELEIEIEDEDADSDDSDEDVDEDENEDEEAEDTDEDEDRSGSNSGSN